MCYENKEVFRCHEETEQDRWAAAPAQVEVWAGAAAEEEWAVAGPVQDREAHAYALSAGQPRRTGLLRRVFLKNARNAAAVWCEANFVSSGELVKLSTEIALTIANTKRKRHT